MAANPTVAVHDTGIGEWHGHAQRGISNPILGMILFIASEVMFFAGLFAAYFNVRIDVAAVAAARQRAALRALQPAHARAPGRRRHPDRDPGAQLGHHAGRASGRSGGAIGRAFLRATGVTVVLGLLFLTGQMWDYTQLEFGITDTAFGSTFYTLTGFHGAHVAGGAIMLSVSCCTVAWPGQFSARHHDMVEATSIYWHFVDVVWIVLFSTLYLL